MAIMLLLALMQNPADSLRFSIIYERPYNDTLILSLAVAEQQHENTLTHTHLRVSFIDRRKLAEKRLITSIRDQFVDSYRVLRTDDSSIVISRHGFYERVQTLKLFLDPGTKAVVKRIDYQPDIGLKAVDDREVTDRLEVPAGIVKQLERPLFEAKPDSSHIPQVLRDHPMRQSTYAEFARMRPARVKHGYYEEGTIIEEGPGPHQTVGSRVWFGKVFYDGEGHTGVGGLGYFDTQTSRYTWLHVPQLADWSVSAILVEEDAVWMGLVVHPEGEDYSGGLLRYDLKTRTSRKFAVEEVVHQIVRWNDRIYVSTTNGAYQVKGGRLTTRYRVEPNIDHRFIILAELLNN